MRRRAEAKPKLQPGVGFHLQPDGTWLAEEIPPDVLQEAVFSGHLTIEGYRSVVFDTKDRQQWAQKISGTSALASVRHFAAWTRPILDDEMGELDRVAEEIGIDIAALQNAFTHGVLKTLTESDWARLENTDSYPIEDLSEARALSERYDRDIESILQAIGSSKNLPAPVVLELDDGTITLVGGNTRLMAARALGISPKVLWMSTKGTSALASRIAAKWLEAKKNDDLMSQVNEIFDDERGDSEYNAAIVSYCDAAFSTLEGLNETLEGCVGQFAKASQELSSHDHEKVNTVFAGKMQEALLDAGRVIKEAGDKVILEIVHDLKKLKTDASRRG